MNAALIHAELSLTINLTDDMTQASIRAKTIELGAPVGKTSLSNLMLGKVEQTGGWSLVKGEEAANEETQEAQDAQVTVTVPAAVINEPTPTNVAEVVLNFEKQVMDTLPLANNTPADQEVRLEGVNAALVEQTSEKAAEKPAEAPKAADKPKASATPKTTSVRYDIEESVKLMTAITSHENLLKRAPTETYVTYKLEKSRVQATIGVRGVTLMLFPLKGLHLDDFNKLDLDWVVKSQYAKVCVCKPEEVEAKLAFIEGKVKEALAQ